MMISRSQDELVHRGHRQLSSSRLDYCLFVPHVQRLVEHYGQYWSQSRSKSPQDWNYSPRCRLCGLRVSTSPHPSGEKTQTTEETRVRCCTPRRPAAILRGSDESVLSQKILKSCSTRN
ncbi:hypothetical protein GE061_008386 [Apolygus lucorum]|uniref:Uncharacterized protein n=1 Tax=Apolygus lucorum TaxID=248454 RepID=A0A8S9WQY0_APOLU|nr:hypothetical protein GE061_008386 [Apolygus lucorum]